VILPVAVLVGTGLACREEPTAKPEPPAGQQFSTSERLGPAEPPLGRAVVHLSGSPFEVELRTERDQNKFRIVLLKDGTEFDREEYVDSFEAFLMSRAAGEFYEPPMELLRFPMQVGDSWQWEGSIRSGDDAQPAKATVETAEDTQYVHGAPVQAVRVRVLLSFGSGEQIPVSKRTLTFWFAPKHGLFRRQYDTVSIREPAAQ
jgi:hypothetical protein